MRKLLWVLIGIVLACKFSPLAIAASSEYILPYPSFMPGSALYRVHLVWEKIMQYWYFGSFGQYEYNLNQSDKYLVEAKTLFEYKQYLFGYNALKNSNNYFQNISSHFLNAKKENKDIIQKQNKLKQAALKHIEILNSIKSQVPNKFIWQEERVRPITLDIHKEIDMSIQVRKEVL